MLTKTQWSGVAIAALLAGLALVPAAPAAAAQVLQYTIQVRTDGGGPVPMTFTDWAANTTLSTSYGLQLQRGAVVASGQDLMFRVDPAAQNGIYLNAGGASIKFWPSQDNKTACLNQGAIGCSYNPATRTVTLTNSEQVNEFTVQTRTYGGGTAPVQFRDWAANTKLFYSNGTPVARGSWISSGSDLRLTIDPAAQNGIWIDTSTAKLKFWPSQERYTGCTSTATGTACQYTPATNTLEIATTTAKVLEWKTGTAMAYGGSEISVPFVDWSADTVLLYADGTPVARGAFIGPDIDLRVIVTDPNPQHDIWVRLFGYKPQELTMNFSPTDPSRTGCTPATFFDKPLCYRSSDGRSLTFIYYNGGN